MARRYHLLSFLENDRTQVLYTRVRELESDPTAFRQACALMVRQNHYVTERCHGALTTALATARGAREQVRAFIDAERGHDRILAGAMRSFGSDPALVPVTDEAKVLMDLLQLSAGRNFLAFAMNVDCFERSAYQESDPLAQALARGGLDSAGRHIDRHKDINDAGEHENVALGFLELMGPVAPEYAAEALRIAEATTHALTLLSHGILGRLDLRS